MAAVPPRVAELVETFNRHIEIYRSPQESVTTRRECSARLTTPTKKSTSLFTNSTA